MPGDTDVTEWKVVSHTSSGWRIVSQKDEYTPLYQGMHRMICKLAWQYARQCALDVEDLISEGYLALLKAERKYDPTRAARSTFVYWVVRNHFWHLTRRWPISQELPDQLSEDPRHALEESHTFREIIGALSKEGKDVIRLILFCPKELCEMARKGTPERMQKAASKLLLKQGWIEEQITSAFSEISRALTGKQEEIDMPICDSVLSGPKASEVWKKEATTESVRCQGPCRAVYPGRLMVKVDKDGICEDCRLATT